MEIRSDTFSNIVGVENHPLPPLPSVSAPSPLNMRMGYGQDGMGIFLPPPSLPYQQGGGEDGIGGAHHASVHSGIINNNHNNTAEMPVKRKRGRPRKYGPDGTMAVPGSGFSLTPGASMEASSSSGTKKKGRPPGSGKKHQMDALGSGGIGFTPHIITVNAGEDVSSKIMSFSQHGPRAVCILSANGAISNVTLRQAATSGGTVTLEGRFEILSLSGSFLLSESGGQRSRTGGLSVSLADPDGRVIGGGVAGFLIAASPVQVVVGSFISDGLKESKPMSNSDPTLAPAKMVPGEMSGAQSPPSHGTMSESSGGGPGSSFNQRIGACNNTNQQIMSSLTWNNVPRRNESM